MIDDLLLELQVFVREMDWCHTTPRKSGFAIVTKQPLRWLTTDKHELGLVRKQEPSTRTSALLKIALNCQPNTYNEADLSRQLGLPIRGPRQMQTGVRVKVDGDDPWDMIEIFLDDGTLRHKSLTNGEVGQLIVEVATKAR